MPRQSNASLEVLPIEGSLEGVNQRQQYNLLRPYTLEGIPLATDSIPMLLRGVLWQGSDTATKVGLDWEWE